MAEELPFGVFLFTYKITTMVQEIFIVTRQHFYASRGEHHAMASDNPIVGAWQSKQMVDDFFKRRIPFYTERGYTCEYVRVPDSIGVLELYTIKNKEGFIDCTYSVILEPVLP